MTRSDMDALLAEFGKTAGLPELAFDEKGYCALVVGETVLNLEMDEPAEELAVYAHVGELPRDPDVGLLDMLLKANLFRGQTRGATLGVDAASETIALARKIPFAGLSDKSFADLLEAFLETAESWRAKIAAYAPKEPEAAEASPAADPRFDFGLRA